MSGSMPFEVDGSSTCVGAELEPPFASLDLVLIFFGDFCNGAFLGGILPTSKKTKCDS
jgi:hypothetical protein